MSTPAERDITSEEEAILTDFLQFVSETLGIPEMGLVLVSDTGEVAILPVTE